MTDEVLFLGGSRVGENFPAMLYPCRELEDAGYEVASVLTMEDGFGADGREQEERFLEELEDDSFHVVGYCAGGNLALRYRDHDNVRSVTVYDPPAGLATDDYVSEVDEPVVDEDVFVIYSVSVDEDMRIDGEYDAAEVRGTGHEFAGKENDLADAVRHGLAYTNPHGGAESGEGLVSLSAVAEELAANDCDVSVYRSVLGVQGCSSR